MAELDIRTQAEQDVEHFFALSLDMLCIAKSDGYFKRVSPAFTRTLGWSADEMLTRPFLDFVHPDDRAATLREVKRQVADNELVLEFENRYQHKDGSWRVLSWKSVPQPGGLMYAIARDITERRRAEEEFRESEERFRNLANNISQLAWMANDQGWIFWYNQRWFDYSGTTLEEMQGWDWQKVHHPDHVKRVVDKIRHCFQTGEIWEDTFPLRGRDGHYRWFLSRAVPIRNDEGRVTRWFGTNTDVTEQREAEEALRQAHDQLELRVQERTAELLKKTRDLETLLYVTSHDLREPLRGIQSFSRMVRDRYADRLDDKGRDFLQRVVRGTERMDQLMTDILNLSRMQRMEVSAEDIECESLVTEVLRRLDHQIKETGATVRVVDPLPRWQGNRTWSTQGVYNLITNALKFHRDGEAPDVEIASYHPTVEDGSVVGIVVRDRGPGVAPEHAERIFQLFQRAVGREIEGTGAGLAIVRQVAERHGGRAWVQAREGGGAEFMLTFDVTNRSKDTSPKGEAPNACVADRG